MKVSSVLYNTLEKHGFKMYIERTKDRVPSVTSVKVPSGVDPVKVLSFAMQKYRLEIGGGLGPTFGQIFRIGLMGNNATQELVDKTVKILVEAVEEASKDKKFSAKL